ncbi:MerR family transcriptional regulator [Streptomyces deserti]
MLIAELARVTGVPIPTIKYYLREGLLTPGQLTGRTRAHYDDTHVHRLLLIRALLHIGGLSLAAIRDVLAALDGEGSASARLPRSIQEPAPHDCGEPPASRTADELLAVAERKGWQVSSCSAEFAAAVGILDTLRELGHGDYADRLDDYAEAADRAASADLRFLRRPGDDAISLERMVVGAVLGDRLLAALRHLALGPRPRQLFQGAVGNQM